MKRSLLSFVVLTFAACSHYSASAQIITTIAGNGGTTYTGDGVLGTTSSLNGPTDVAVDGSENVYIPDWNNQRIRKVDAAGIISTFAGTGAAYFSGDGGPATAATLDHAVGVGTDNAGNVVWAETDNRRVRKVNLAGIINTMAGTGTPGYTGDGGPGTAANIAPDDAATDSAGNIYIVDAAHHIIRKISTSGIITTVCGNGSAGSSGDGGSATAAEIGFPQSLTIDNTGNIFFCDQMHHIVRKVNSAGIITTIAGNGTMGYSGDGAPATAAQLNNPMGIAVDRIGNVYIADRNNHRIRKVATNGNMYTIAGIDSAGFSGDGGPATSARLDHPWGVAVSSSGKIYIADLFNHRVRMISNMPSSFNAGSLYVMDLCMSSLSLDTILSAVNSNVAELMTWSLLSSPSHGSATVAYSAYSTGGLVIPAGTTYAPSPGYTGTDTFKVRITDDASADTITIALNIATPPVAGTLSGPTTVCVGNSIAITGSMPGGTWLSSPAASVSSTGLVTGVSAGTASISYIVSNICGSDTALYTVQVTNCPYLTAASIATGVPYRIVHPNPNTGEFTITPPTQISPNARLTITDITGRSITSFYLASDRSIPVKLDCDPGVYFLSIETNSGSVNEKIIVLD